MIRAGSVGRESTLEFMGCDEDGEVDTFYDQEWDEKGRTMISHIFVAYDEVIRSIQFGYLENGALVMSKKYGPTEGYNFRVVRLDHDEYITGLSGVIGGLGTCNAIRNLTFHTNRGNHGPIGRSSDGYPSRSVVEIHPAIRDPSEFGGFFGSYTPFNLSSIGLYLNPYGMSDPAVKP